MKWTHFWPAIGRPRFWRVARDIAIRGAATGALLYALTYSGAIAHDKLKDTAEGGGWTDWIDGLDGSNWLLYLTCFFSIGAVLYASRRIWSSEAGGEAADALDELAAITLPFRQLTVDGRSAFGIWGGMLVRRTPLHKWLLEIAQDISILGQVQPPGGFTVSAVNDPEESREAGGALFRVLEEWGLADRAPGYESALMLDAPYQLTPQGRVALLAAKKLAHRRHPNLRHLRGVRSP